MASSTELLMILGLYVLVASTAITFIINGNSQIAFGQIIDGNNYNSLLINANLSDFNFVPIKGSWQIDNANGLHATALTESQFAVSYVYNIDGNSTYYAECNLCNLNVSNNISEFYTIKNFISKTTAFAGILGTDKNTVYTYFASWINDKTDFLLFGHNYYFVVQANRVYISDRETYIGFGTGVQKHFFDYILPTTGNLTIGYYYHYDTKNIDLFVNGVKRETISFDMGIPNNDNRVRKVFTNSKNLGITNIGTTLQANVIEHGNDASSWLSTFAFVLLWNVDEQYLPLWFNIIAIKLPLIIIGWILARFLWGS